MFSFECCFRTGPLKVSTFFFLSGTFFASTFLVLTSHTQVEGGRAQFPWCSGYHVRLTRERSLVRNQAETLTSRLTLLLFQHCGRSV